MELFRADENGEVNGCADLPEFKSECVRRMVAALQPEGFDDLVKICGLYHGTNVPFDSIDLSKCRPNTIKSIAISKISLL